MKLFDSELKIMDLIWQNGELSAKKIAEALKEQVGWSKTTTYTVIKKCIDKGAIERSEPGFICRAIITNEQVRAFETNELINKMYNGSSDMLIASLLGGYKLSKQEIEQLKDLINKLSNDN